MDGALADSLVELLYMYDYGGYKVALESLCILCMYIYHRSSHWRCGLLCLHTLQEIGPGL